MALADGVRGSATRDGATIGDGAGAADVKREKGARRLLRAVAIAAES